MTDRRTDAAHLVSPAALKAAWATWRVRHHDRLGPGPGFSEALEAGFRAALAERADAIRALPTAEGRAGCD